jgi:hypothetical protein
MSDNCQRRTLHDVYDATDPASSKAADLVKQIATLNASVAGLSQKLRLTVQNKIGWDAVGDRTERVVIDPADDPDDGLLGGYARQ